MINYFKELLATLKSIDNELKKQNKKIDDLTNRTSVGRPSREITYIHTKHYKEGSI